MSEFKGTPGPWDWLLDDDDVIVVVKRNGYIIQRRIAELPDNGEEDEANAQLMAAARELLASLQELVYLKDHLKATDPQEYERRKPLAWEAARKSIAKAEGEETA